MWWPRASDGSRKCQYSLISVGVANSASDGVSEGLSVSADGRFIAFASRATNLVSNGSNISFDVFVTLRRAEQTQ
jgi:hypothetical protein